MAWPDIWKDGKRVDMSEGEMKRLKKIEAFVRGVHDEGAEASWISMETKTVLSMTKTIRDQHEALKEIYELHQYAESADVIEQTEKDWK